VDRSSEVKGEYNRLALKVLYNKGKRGKKEEPFLAVARHSP
jgi:hypothetical protein